VFRGCFDFVIQNSTGHLKIHGLGRCLVNASIAARTWYEMGSLLNFQAHSGERFDRRYPLVKMRLLVTNTRNPQAYTIIRALRAYCEQLVVTMYGKNRLAARLSHAANSRLVDKRYYVPSPVEDWRAGRIQKENTEREEAYVQAILRICEQEKIDTIFPSFDAHVYVFSKNKERFEKLGIVIPIPDYDVVITPLDKYRTIKAAEEVGFPCPKTFLPESEEDIERIANELGFPLVIKPRFTAGGRGTEIVMNSREFLKAIRLLSQRQGLPMVQEYIPGCAHTTFNIVIDKQLNVKAVDYVALLRRVPFVTVSELLSPHPNIAQARELLQKLGWWGSVTVQMKTDLRDNLPKLMEINPRPGIGLWRRTVLGSNEPLMCLNIARGQTVEPKTAYHQGILFVDPLEDMAGLGFRLLDLFIYKLRVGVRGELPIDPLNPPMSIKELFLSYKETYLSGKKKVFNHYFTYFFQDPLPSILWWSQCLNNLVKARNQLGR
jgi:biotin carboxylase